MDLSQDAGIRLEMRQAREFFEVKLRSFNKPTPDRWTSFGWTVIKEGM